MPLVFQTCSLAMMAPVLLVIEILELVVQCQHVELFSSADRAGDVQDLLSARHRAGTPLVGPLAGLGVELQPVKTACLKRENAVSDTQIGDIGTQEDYQTSNA